MLAIRSVGEDVEALIVVDEIDGRGRGSHFMRVRGNGGIEVLDALNGGGREASRVQGQEVGEDDLHVWIVGTHLRDENVVGGEDVGHGLSGDEDIVGAEEHEDDVRFGGGEPCGKVSILCKVRSEGAREALVVLVNVYARAVAGLGADKVEVVDADGAERGLEIGAPAM